MESKGKIEIIQTGITTAKILLNGQDISGMVSGYTITHEANRVAKNKKSAKDVITFVASYPDGTKKTLRPGKCVSSLPGKSVASGGRIKTGTYKTEKNTRMSLSIKTQVYESIFKLLLNDLYRIQCDILSLQIILIENNFQSYPSKRYLKNMMIKFDDSSLDSFLVVFNKKYKW